MPNRAERRAQNGRAQHPPPPPPAPPPGGMVVAKDAIPPKIMEALTRQPNPYELLGMAHARNVQLEGVVGAMIEYLSELASHGDDAAAALVAEGTEVVAEAGPGGSPES